MKTDAQLQQDGMAELKWEPAVHAMNQPDSAFSALPVFDDHAAAEDASTTHRARITGPVIYLSGCGRRQHIPIGPCLVERHGGRSIDIIWGTRGQSSVALPVEAIKAAQDLGHLVLLD